MNDLPTNSSSSNPMGSYVTDYAPPATPSDSETSEALEDQNIFFLLGVTDGGESEREAFLDELQQVIWEDFLENDARLLITDAEMGQLKQLLDKQVSNDLEKQEEIVVFLEKLIPDLEEIMLDKALQLKADLVRERITGMKEYYASQPQHLQTLTDAEKLVEQEKWYSAAQLLNTVK